MFYIYSRIAIFNTYGRVFRRLMLWRNTVASTKSPEVTIDRREPTADRRESEDRRKSDQPVAEDRRQEPRRKVARRRQIDPTTCERDYSDQEIEFMQAMDAYKRSSGRMFPTCSEILEVLRDLGYQQVGTLDDANETDEDEATLETDAELTEDLEEELEEEVV